MSIFKGDKKIAGNYVGIVFAKAISTLTEIVDKLVNNFSLHKDNLSIHTPALTANKTIYVSPSGSDESGDGSEGKPYKSINYASSKAPKLLLGYILTLIIAEGNYNEDVILKDFIGGTIYVHGTENVILKSLTILNVKNVCWYSVTIAGFTPQNNQVVVAFCQEVCLWGFKCTTVDKTKIGIHVASCSKMQIYNSEISGKNVAVQSNESAVYTCLVRGSDNNIGYLAGGSDMATGGTIAIGYGCTLTATILTQEQFGGKIW